MKNVVVAVSVVVVVVIVAIAGTIFVSLLSSFGS